MGYSLWGLKKSDMPEGLILNTRKKRGEKQSDGKEVMCSSRTPVRLTGTCCPRCSVSHTFIIRKRGGEKIFFLSRHHISVISASSR